MRKGLFKVIMVLTIVSICIGGVTYAYVGKKTDKLQNNFEPKKYTDVEIIEPNGQDYKIDEEGNLNNEKSAYFTNPDNNTKDEYIRATIIAVVRNEDGSNAGIQPKLDIAYNEGSKWIYNTDGYYYYTEIVRPGESTTNLFDNVKVSKETVNLLKEGQRIELSVIADSIESTKVKEAWGIDPSTLK